MHNKKVIKKTNIAQILWTPCNINKNNNFMLNHKKSGSEFCEQTLECDHHRRCVSAAVYLCWRENAKDGLHFGHSGWLTAYISIPRTLWRWRVLPMTFSALISTRSNFFPDLIRHVAGSESGVCQDGADMATIDALSPSLCRSTALH